jgi:hypothetical protein
MGPLRTPGTLVMQQPAGATREHTGSMRAESKTARQGRPAATPRPN